MLLNINDIYQRVSVLAPVSAPVQTSLDIPTVTSVVAIKGSTPIVDASPYRFDRL
tara:strand:- start:22 stop:186 length:165 start_codon:yes stop_codon:yes gene_type:complete